MEWGNVTSSKKDPRDPAKQIVTGGVYVTNKGFQVEVFEREGRFAFFTFKTQLGTNRAELRRVWPTERFHISRHHWFEAEDLQEVLPPE